MPKKATVNIRPDEEGGLYFEFPSALAYSGAKLRVDGPLGAAARSVPVKAGECPAYEWWDGALYLHLYRLPLIPQMLRILAAYFERLPNVEITLDQHIYPFPPSTLSLLRQLFPNSSIVS